MLKHKLSRTSIGIALFCTLGAFASGAAQAAVGYCVAPAPASSTLSLADITFTIGSTVYSPTDCYGLVDTGSADVTNNLNYVNGLRWEDFLGGVKDDIGGGSNSTTVDSIQYTLSTLTNGGSGLNTTQTWSLAWSDSNGSALPNLPATVDFAVLWNGGNNDAFYLFEDVVLPISPNFGDGLIYIKATNPPGNSDLGTSHIDVFFSDATNPTFDPPTGGDPNPTPEPGTLSLLAASMLGAVALSRRRKTAV
jgi:hypothetical protein